MLRIVIIGGTGHVGTYLVPRLVQSGHALRYGGHPISERCV
jgi:uncharacterized protein YbjT (DUF2867 family)